MSCVILYKAFGKIDIVRVGYGNEPDAERQFFDRGAARKWIDDNPLTHVDWFEIVPLPMHTPAKPVSPTR